MTDAAGGFAVPEVLARHLTPENMSAVLEPPRWRIFKHRYWRRHCQPEHMAHQLRVRLIGEASPLASFGVRIEEG